MANTDPQRDAANQLAQAAARVLAGLSNANFRRLRAGTDTMADRPDVLIERDALRELLLAVDETHPGYLDHVRASIPTT